MHGRSSLPTRSTAAPCLRSSEINDRLQDRVQAADRAGPRADHGRLHRRDPRRRAHHDRPRRLRLFRRAGRRRAERRAHRDLDRRGRHEDHRPAHLCRCAPHQGHQLRRSRRARLLRRQGIASRDRAAGGREEHSGAGAEFAQSVERRARASCRARRARARCSRPSPPRTASPSSRSSPRAC